ncbi:hypothetical protein VRK_11300 [Vibrio sp. MEBiC08052]|nr:hypothetical protein VRK_11300 [Vibrio sp. MEBiC08052]
MLHYQNETERLAGNCPLNIEKIWSEGVPNTKINHKLREMILIILM